MKDPAFVEGLQRRLTDALHEPEIRAGSRAAAVLILLYRRNGQIWIPLIQRASSQGVHSGQIALPGGAFEVEDRSLMRTALREAAEEIGLKPSSVRVLGRLDPVLVRVSGFEVAPYVGWRSGALALSVNDQEVERIIDMPARLLIEPNGISEQEAPVGSPHSTVFELEIGAERVWGATARMLAQLSKACQGLKFE